MFEEIKNQIAELLNVEPEKITADSMDIATLLLEVEEKYGTEISEDDMDSLQTVGDIVKYLETKK